MAEGEQWQRSFKDSFSKASGDADESFCDPCKSDGEWKGGEGYCQKCDEYLCKTCLGMHRKQKITRAHVILDKKQMPSGQGSVGNQDLCVEICKMHHPKIIRFYCKAHDKPGCGDCMTLDHTACTKDRVQDISDGFKKTKEFQHIDQQLQLLQRDLEKMEGELDNNLKNLDKTYNNILHKVATVRKQINEYLDKIQKKVTDEAAQMKKDDETELKALQTENQAMKAEIEAMLKTLHDSNVNVNSLFVIAKQAKHRLMTMEKEMNIINKSQQQQYEFQISNEIEKIVSAKMPLGKLSRKNPQQIRAQTKKRDQNTPQIPTIDTTATYNRSIRVNNETDRLCSCITDMTLLSADRVVVTDGNSNKVKLIDLSNNTVKSSYSLSSYPYGVTALSTNMIAVTLADEGKIQVLNVTTTFTLQQEIRVNKGCLGIAYKDGKFAVSYMKPGRVDILNIQDNILHVHTIQPTGDILQEPYYIIFGHDKDTVIVSDYITNNISVVTFRGQILRTYTHDTLRVPRGIAIIGDGVLFVCSLGGGCIHVVSPDFKTSKIIINNDKHVVNPNSILYCESSHTLYISNYNIHQGDLKNQIQLYDLNM